MKTTKLRRLTASTLALALLLPQLASAAAPMVETDEAVYVNLDYYGVPDDTRIVKGVSLNGHTAFTDYGDYAGVYNMSTFDQPLIEDGAVTWELSDTSRQRFYYECIPTGETPLEMPWDFDVSYKRNGVPVAAEKCAGASGLVEMNIHAIPNKNADEYYQNNMMLICATGIDMSKALSIDAPGAQVQSMGTYKIVVFMGLPGEENTFTVRIGSNDFESMGLILFMAPATLSSLDLLADMRDIKDRIGSSGDSLYEGLSEMLKTMQSMQGGLATLSGGIAGINEVRRQLTDARGTIDPKADDALAALDALAGQSDAMLPELHSMKSTLVTLNATVNSMLGTLEDSDQNVTNYQKLLRDLNVSLGNVQDLLDELDGQSSSNWLYLSELKSEITALRNDLNKLQSNMKTLRERMDALNGQLALLESALDVLEANGILSAEQAQVLHAMLDSADEINRSLQTMLGSLENATKRLNDLLATSGSMLERLDDLNDILEDYETLPDDFVDEGKQFTLLLDHTLEDVHKLIADIPALSESLEVLTGNVTSMLDKGESLMLALTKSLTTAAALLTAAQDTLRSVRDQSDQSLQTSIDGLLDVLAKATASNSSSSLQSATDSIHQAIDDGKKDLEEDTNLLNLDAEAALQSVTSAQNPSPASLQFILRTREISVDDLEDPSADAAESEDVGVLGRIANIFKQLFSAIAGVFAANE